MNPLEARVARLEAVHRRPAGMLTAAEQAEIEDSVRMLRHLVPGGATRHEALHELLQDLERGTATDEDLARVGGVNVEILRVVARLEASY